MRGKEIVGMLITVFGLVLLFYELAYVGLTKSAIGVKGDVSTDAVLVTTGWMLILVGPALWFGEVPVNIKKMIEAKTGKKVER